jgi:hypothetical protein
VSIKTRIIIPFSVCRFLMELEHTSMTHNEGVPQRSTSSVPLQPFKRQTSAT